jgi:hypothetical protein
MYRILEDRWYRKTIDNYKVNAKILPLQLGNKSNTNKE